MPHKRGVPTEVRSSKKMQRAGIPEGRGGRRRGEGGGGIERSAADSRIDKRVVCAMRQVRSPG